MRERHSRCARSNRVVSTIQRWRTWERRRLQSVLRSVRLRHAGSLIIVAPMPYSDPARQRAYQREWMARRRAAWFADKHCVVCGSTDDLEVDHRDPAQKVDHKVWSWSATRRDAELVKCDVKCAKHHRRRHADERIVPHGARGYRHRGCRCDVCRAWQSAKNRNRYKPGNCRGPVM